MLNQFILTPFFLDEPMPGLEVLMEHNWLMNKPHLPEGDPQKRMSVTHRVLSDFVEASICQGVCPVSVAGDCCTAIGVLAGLQRSGIEPYLMWFDAHGDFNTWDTTLSGFLGGMPLAMLVGRGEQRMPGSVGLQSIPEEDVLLTDARDLDPGEKIALESSKVFHVKDVEELFTFELPNRPIYVHFDTDVIDPGEAPAMNYTASNGPSSDALKAIFHHIAQTERIVAVSVSTWNPYLDGDGSTQAVCKGALEFLLEA
ncbi:MAG: arginase family protein [Chloroflexota bacterium]|nr:arginase family protein [Chloroflexota bacterium]